MLGILKHIKASNNKRFFFSILVLSLFASATNYASFTELIPKPKTSLVHSESVKKTTVDYDTAIRIAFSHQCSLYSKYQERIFSTRTVIAQIIYVQRYITPSQKGFYIHTTLDSEDEHTPILFS